MPHITRKRLALAKDVFRPSSIAGRAVLVSSVLASYLLSDVRILLKGSSHNNFMTGAMAAPGEKETPNKSAIRAFTSLHEFLKTGDVTKLDDFETVWQQYPSSSQKFEDFKKFFFEVIKEDPIIMLVIRTYNEYKKPKELDLDEVLKEVCQIHEQLNLKDLDYNGLKRKYPGQEATRFLETILEARLGSEFLLDLKKGATPTVLLEGLLADSKKSFTELEKQTDSYLLGMDKTSKDALKSRLEEEHFASLRQRLEELEKNPKLDKAIAFDTDVKTLQQEIRISAYIAYQFSLYLYTGDNSFFDRNASSLGGGISTGGVPFDVNVRMGFLSAKDKDYDWRESQNRLPVDSLFSLYLQSYTKWMLPGFESVTAKKASTLGDAATFGQNLRPVMETANSVLRLDRSKYADAWHNLEYQYKEVTGDSRDIILRARIYDENTWSEIAYNSWGVVKDKRTSLGEMPLNFENWLELSESTHQMQAWKDTVNSVLDQYGRVKKESGVWKYKSSAEQAAALQKKSPKDAAKEAITISSRELQERSVIESLRLKMTVVDAYFFDEAVRKLQSISMLSDPAITSLVETLASIYDRDPYLASSFLHNVVPVAAESYDQDGFVAILANFRASVENVLASDLPRHERRKFLLDVFKDLEGIPEQIAVYNKKNMESELRQYPKDSFEYVNAFAMRASQLLGRDAFFQELLPIMPALGLFQTLPQGPTDVGGAAFAITFLSSAEVIHSEVRANLEGKLIPKFEQMIPAQARLKRWDYQAFITAMRAKFNNMPVEYADFSDWLSAGAGMAGYANSAGKIDAIEEGFFQTATGGGSFHGQETITQNPDSKLINIQESLAGVDTVAGPLHTQDGYINWSETKGVGTVEDDAARAYAQIARNTGHNILFMQEGYYRNLESTNSSATSIKGGELQVETGSTWRRKGRIGYSDKYGQTILIATSQAKDNNYVTYTPFDVATGKPSSSSYDVIKETDSALGERAFYTTKDGKKHLLPSDLQQTAVTALSGTMGQLWQVINNYTYARLGLEPGATMPANQGVEADIKSMPFWKNPALSRGTSLNGFSMGYDLGDWSIYGIKGDIIEFQKGEKIFGQGGGGVMTRNIFDEHDAIGIFYRASVPTEIPGVGKLTEDKYSQVDIIYQRLPKDQNKWAFFGRIMAGGISPSDAALIPGAAVFSGGWSGATLGLEVKGERITTVKIKEEEKVIKRMGYGAILGHAALPLPELTAIALTSSEDYAKRVENYLSSAYGYELDHEDDKSKRIGLFAGGTYLHSILTTGIRKNLRSGAISEEEAKTANDYGSAMVIGWYQKHSILIGAEKVPYFIDASQRIEQAQQALVENPEYARAIMESAVSDIKGLKSAERTKFAFGYGWDDRVYVIAASDFETMAGMRAIALITGDPERDKQWVGEAVAQITHYSNPAILDTLARLSFPLPGTRWLSRASLGAGPVFAASIPLKSGAFGEPINESESSKIGTIRKVGWTYQGILRTYRSSDPEGWEVLSGLMGSTREINDYSFYSVSETPGNSTSGKRRESELQILPITAEKLIKTSGGAFDKTNTYLLIDNKNRKVYAMDSSSVDTNRLVKLAAVDESAWLFTVGFNKSTIIPKDIRGQRTVSSSGWDMIVSAGPLNRKTGELPIYGGASKASVAGGAGVAWSKTDETSLVRVGSSGGIGTQPNFFTVWDSSQSNLAFTPLVSSTDQQSKNPWWVGAYVQLKF